jgi:hypothetical protein
MGFGDDLTGLQDFELSAILHRAGAMVEDYCAVSNSPTNRYSFLGGEIKDEQQSWRLPENYADYGQRRIYPFVHPIKAVTNFKVKVSNNQYITIAPENIFINNAERYIEVVSLAFTGVGLFGAILPTLGLMRPVAVVSYTYGYLRTENDETLYATDARTYRSESQFWDTDFLLTPVIKVNGVTQTAGYVIDYTEGVVKFASNLPDDDVVTATYTSVLPHEIAYATGIIASHLIGLRQNMQRGMEGIQMIKVGEVTISKPRMPMTSLPQFSPEAAVILGGFRSITLR